MQGAEYTFKNLKAKYPWKVLMENTMSKYIVITKILNKERFLKVIVI